MQAILPNSDKNSVLIPLYSGIGLIVVSILFLGREIGHSSAPFFVQATAILAAPAFFYLVGAVIYRKLNAPLAAPGIVATGAWLIGVALIHLYVRRYLLPAALQDYYALTASLIAAVLITLTGHRINTKLLLPLVPLAQIFALWEVFATFGVSVAWIPPLSFGLVYAWWELPIRDSFWASAYKGSAVVFTLFLLVFNLWLPAASGETRMAAWAAGAVVVALIGLRHGWSRLAPLAIVLLAVAVAWGMPKALWSSSWLVLASATVVVIERAKVGDGKGAKITELSEALAVTLSGIAAAFAALAPMFGAAMHPLAVVGVLAAAGALLVWLGWRRGLRMATHVGLWLMASAWGSFYFIAVPDSGTFGLWLALFASVALLTERILTQRRIGEKRKAPTTLIETVIRWPFADLVIGLSAIILLWSAWNIEAVAPTIITVTLLLAIGIWIAAGMIYRLPVLLHIALWIAPIPFALLLMIAAPALWSLPLMGLEWQFLALIYLLIGHASPRYRPPMLAPFFVAGYGLLGFGLMIGLNIAAYVPISLGIVVLTCIGTSAAVLLKRHPAWDVFVEQIAPRETRPFAYRHIRSLFLFLSSWFGAVWIQIMLGYTSMTLARQGVFLVVFAGLFFLIGRALSRLPSVALWSVTSAGWLLWLIGLLQVFFSPPEAIITLILGLALSLDAFTRTRSMVWIPAIILNLFVAALEIAWMLGLPAHAPLMVLAVIVGVAGTRYERKVRRVGRIVALTGAAITLAIAVFQPDSVSLLGMLALTLGLAVSYRQPLLLYVSYGLAGLLIAPTLPHRQPFDQIALSAQLDSMIMAVTAIGIALVVPHIALQWWARPVRTLGVALVFLSYNFALMLPFYVSLQRIPSFSGTPVGDAALSLTVIPLLLIVVWCALTYRQTGQVVLLGAALLPCVQVWSLLFPSAPESAALPIGIGLFVIARRMTSPYFALIEYAAVTAVMLAAVGEINFREPTSPENLLFALYVAALGAYGIVGGRRIPFVAATGIVGGGVVVLIGKVNGWLIPLVGGGVLIAAAVFMESQRNTAEQISGVLRSRWQAWK